MRVTVGAGLVARPLFVQDEGLPRISGTALREASASVEREAGGGHRRAHRTASGRTKKGPRPEPGALNAMRWPASVSLVQESTGAR